MITNRNSPTIEAERQAEARADELIREFQAFYEAYREAHPEHAEKKREVFEAWALQKIAGLQLCVEHISEQFNLHVQGHKML